MLAILFAKPSYDVIHAHLGNACILGRRISKISGIPIIATLHGFQKAKHYRGIKHFTAVSESVKNHFVAQGIRAQQIVVIPNGYDPIIQVAPFSTPSMLYGLSIQNRYVISTVGVLSAVKNHDMLIEAMRLVVSQHPKALLLIAGKGSLKDTLDTAIKAHGLQDHIYLVGHQPDVTSLYRSAQLYVQASIAEGFCLPLLEAMACGTPVITTPCLGPLEFISPGIHGTVLTDFTPETMAKAIIACIQKPDDAKERAMRALQHVTSYQWPCIATQYIQYMKALHA